jgi:hypothetical protein
MKKVYFLLALIFITAMSYGQNSIIKQAWEKTIIGSHSAAGVADSVVVSLQANQSYAFQVRPRLLSAGADSIYAKVQLYQSLSDSKPAWTAIACNDTYTSAASKMLQYV